MLFFKDLLEEKFKDQPFLTLYNQECHICSATMEVVARMALCEETRDEILALLDIDPADFESLEAGDQCKPLQVVRLLKHFGMDESAVTKRCQRYAGLI
ncbi:hypothetical protein [uncultured Desulfobacter sp.]|uniref:hypothetical protein n=1 Tax=uncultured Desulfobacter sp. TaxID=240139 RepID=UPI002AAAF259|nr:hypothetical protein [uncultured Desulfobacter sp.]